MPIGTSGPLRTDMKRSLRSNIKVISVTLLWALHAVTKQQFVLPLFYYSAEYECYSVVEYE